jgi:hypothetical protein
MDEIEKKMNLINNSRPNTLQSKEWGPIWYINQVSMDEIEKKN